MMRAARLLEEGPAKLALEKAKLSLRRGKDALAHRQKLIKVADRSKLGWAVVAEYETNSLAADSDDEKRLERTVAHKRSKANEVEKARKTMHDVPERAKAPGCGGTERVHQGWLSFCYLVRCCVFLCDGPGHIKRDCPRNTVGTYPFSLVVQDGVVQARTGGGAEHVWGRRG